MQIGLCPGSDAIVVTLQINQGGDENEEQGRHGRQLKWL
jgi:hypothetical protein